MAMLSHPSHCSLCSAVPYVPGHQLQLATWQVAGLTPNITCCMSTSMDCKDLLRIHCSLQGCNRSCVNQNKAHTFSFLAALQLRAIDFSNNTITGSLPSNWSNLTQASATIVCVIYNVMFNNVCLAMHHLKARISRSSEKHLGQCFVVELDLHALVRA